ncbi:MAG: hypothetical protein AB7S51_02840 [Porticoccaceae bacterium]
MTDDHDYTHLPILDGVRPAPACLERLAMSGRMSATFSKPIDRRTMSGATPAESQLRV